MTVIDYNTILSTLNSKIEKAARNTKGIYVKNIAFDTKLPIKTVEIETSEPVHMAHVIEQVINKYTYGVNRGYKIYEGFYDWASNSYIKDCVVVMYSVK